MASSRRTWLIVVGILIVVSFLAGYVPVYLEKRALDVELSLARDRLQFLECQSELGMVLIEVAQENYGNARDRSTKFFNTVRQSTLAVGRDDLGEKLAAVLDRRDEINSDLTALRPETADKLRALYLELYRAAAAQ